MVDRRSISGRPSRAKARPISSEDPHLSGADFVARCRADDPGTKEEFVHSYGSLIRFAAFSVLKKKNIVLDDSQRDDLVQGLLLFFFDQDCRRLKMYTGRDGASFATFIRVCATRYTLDQIRRWHRQPTVVSERIGGEERSILEDLRSPHSGPEETAAAREQIARLRERLQKIPERERVLVRLHFVEGVPIPEVAKVLGLSSNAAHGIKSRLRSRLREFLGGNQDA